MIKVGGGWPRPPTKLGYGEGYHVRKIEEQLLFSEFILNKSGFRIEK